MKLFLAEFIGTMVLVLSICGSAALSGDKIGWLGISFAAGTTVTVMSYVFGKISGSHLNPAVTIGLVAAGYINPASALLYILAQFLGAIVGVVILLLLLQGMPVLPEQAKLLGANECRATIGTSFFAEAFFTFLFVLVILGATGTSTSDISGLAIGLDLFVIHLILIPITSASINPARSVGPALFVRGVPMQQLWLFITAPILGAILAGLLWRGIFMEKK